MSAVRSAGHEDKNEKRYDTKKENIFLSELDEYFQKIKNLEFNFVEIVAC